MISCTRKLHFDAAHRIVNHESKCRFMHGHRYVVEATFVSEGLDLLGRVVDFGVIKEKLGNWIDDNWDHNTILWDKDNKLGDLIASQTNQRVFYLPYNPTAENLANYLLTNVCPVIFSSDLVKCVNIKLSETPNCYASAS
jgi:6-pyruvoyltetrahydropterin/6-carboxytetrahydropterin synthase